MAYAVLGGRHPRSIVDRGVGLSGSDTGEDTYAAYPWKPYTKSLKPGFEGSEKIASKVVNKAFDQIAPIIAAVATGLGLTMEQIGPTFRPGEMGLGRRERAYFARVLPVTAPPASSGGKLSGLGATPSTRELIQSAAKQAVLQEFEAQAIKVATNAMGSSVPIAGAVVAIVNVLKDLKAATKTKEALVMAAAAIASAVAACWVPIIGWVYAALALCYGGFQYWRASKAAAEAQEQQERAKAFEKFVKSVVNLVVGEAKALAGDMANRGIGMEDIKKAGNPKTRLMTHYATLLNNFNCKAPKGVEWMEDNKNSLKPQYDKARASWQAERDKLGNDLLKKAIVQWDLNQASLPFVKRRPAVVNGKVIPEVLDPIKKKIGGLSGAPPSYEGVLAYKIKMAGTVTRSDMIKYMLQAARDMRILRLILRLFPGQIPAEQVQQLVQKEMQSPTVARAVSQEASAAIKEMAPEVGSALGKIPPKEAAQFMAAAMSGTGEPEALDLKSPAAKVVVTVAAVGAAAGLALLVWKLVAASRAVR